MGHYTSLPLSPLRNEIANCAASSSLGDLLIDMNGPSNFNILNAAHRVGIGAYGVNTIRTRAAAGKEHVCTRSHSISLLLRVCT